MFVNATPPDEHGFCSLGTSVEAMHAAIEAARTVIVQFNRAMPRTLGDSFVHVEPDRPGGRVRRPAVRASRSATSARSSGASAQHVAELVQDGATIQLGIGAIPAAVALFLRDKHDLGVHTEMFTDAIVDLVEAGVVTGARKERNRGKIVTAFMMGTAAAVRVRPRQPDDRDAADRLHQRHPRHPHVLADDRDQLGDRGRPDRPGRAPTRSATGCTAASAGRWTSSVARRWRRRVGRSSRCRRRRATGASRGSCRTLAAGAGVVTTRAHARTIVTEYGVAELFGRSIRERAKALIAIADPEFRDELTVAARRYAEL